MFKTYMFDIECYSNYFLVVFYNIETKEYLWLKKYNEAVVTNTDEFSDSVGLENFLLDKSNMFVGFNSINYDMPMICAYVSTVMDKSGFQVRPRTNLELKEVSDFIIGFNGFTSDIYKYNNIHKVHSKIGNERVYPNHTDLSKLTPRIGLKMIGANLGFPKLQELPVDVTKHITNEEEKMLFNYCKNDCRVTEAVYNELKGAIDYRISLNDKHGIDHGAEYENIINMSDVKLGSHLMVKEMGIRKFKTQDRIHELFNKPNSYKAPDYIKFKDKDLQKLVRDIENTTFMVKQSEVKNKFGHNKVDLKEVAIDDTTGEEIPKDAWFMKQLVNCGDLTLVLGAGGLHSNEKTQHVIPNEDEILCEFDVGSMYPSIIIENNYCPHFLKSSGFIKTFSDAKENRMKYKMDPTKGNESLTEKNKLNSAAGQMKSPYSPFFDPFKNLSLCLTGQLSLIWLIENLTLAGGKVVSANTDGVNVIFNKKDEGEIMKVVADFQKQSKLSLEQTKYDSIHSRDVNNYFAVLSNGSMKVKGYKVKNSISKSPEFNVCTMAAIENIKNGTDVEEFIRNHSQVCDFMAVKRVTGHKKKDNSEKEMNTPTGALYKGERVGKLVRFYKSTKGSDIYYINSKFNEAKISNGGDAALAMDLPDTIPQDIDYDFYVTRANKIINDLGVDNRITID